jgi:hypothetical protein
MSWECETCEDTHPGRFSYCPIGGAHRASTLENMTDNQLYKLCAEAETRFLALAAESDRRDGVQG